MPLLVNAVLSAMGADHHARAGQLRTEEFVAELTRHTWPGNLREPRNHLERCLTLEVSQPFEDDAQGPQPALDASLTLSAARGRWLRAFERRYASELLREHGDNVSAAARAAGVDRTTFHRLLTAAAWARGAAPTDTLRNHARGSGAAAGCTPEEVPALGAPCTYLSRPSSQCDDLRHIHFLQK